MSRRDADTERILPKLTRVLPSRALATIADAVELDALSEALDQHLALQPGFGGAAIDAVSYAVAYRACSNRPERERQIALTRRIGDALDELTRKPLLEGTLKLMRKPAQAAGLGALQNFLERGFVAFKAMHGAREFLDTIQERETLLMLRLFGAVEDPFTGLAARPVA